MDGVVARFDVASFSSLVSLDLTLVNTAGGDVDVDVGWQVF